MYLFLIFFRTVTATIIFVYEEALQNHALDTYSNDDMSYKMLYTSVSIHYIIGKVMWSHIL